MQIRTSFWDKGLMVISGCMFSGKTTTLRHMLSLAEIGGLRTQLFKPQSDNRFSNNEIITHDKLKKEAISVVDPVEILDLVDDDTVIVGIDEIQFIPETLVGVCKELVARGISVVAAGLDTDFRAEPWTTTKELSAIADKRETLYAVCMECSRLVKSGQMERPSPAFRTQRIIDGKPAPLESPQFLLGGVEAYEARCLDHYQPPQ